VTVIIERRGDEGCAAVAEGAPSPPSRLRYLRTFPDLEMKTAPTSLVCRVSKPQPQPQSSATSFRNLVGVCNQSRTSKGAVSIFIFTTCMRWCVFLRLKVHFGADHDIAIAS
jgi:hypothetical protein